MPDLRRAASRIVTGLPATGLDAAFERRVAELPWAGFLLFRRDFRDLAALAALTRRLRELTPRRPLVCMDEEGGFVSQLAPQWPVPPSARVLGRAASEDEVRALAAHTGRALAGLGVDVDFAPVLDVDVEPANPVIGPRAFAGDADRVTRHGLAFQRGLESAGTIPCAKHFPGHGDTRLDSHLALPTCRSTREELTRRELPPFRAAIAAGTPLVMVSHVHYTAFDPEPVPATLSPAIVDGWLRTELGFDGVIVTDALEMKAVDERYDAGAAAVRALQAGCDLLLYGTYGERVESALAAIERAERRGELEGDRLEASSSRIERLRRRLPPASEPCAPDPEAPPVPLEGLCARALRWVGATPAAPYPGGVVIESPPPHGASLAARLGGGGRPVRTRSWEALAVSSEPLEEPRLAVWYERTRPPAEALARLAGGDPDTLWIVALGQDAFLQEFPGAAARLSACDPGEPMRAAVTAALLAPPGPGPGPAGTRPALRGEPGFP